MIIEKRDYSYLFLDIITIKCYCFQNLNSSVKITFNRQMSSSSFNSETHQGNYIYSGRIIIAICIMSCHKETDNSIVNPSMTIETINRKSS